MSIKFGVCADLHVDIMHDGEDRLKAFLDVCREKNVDFIIRLGDFCYSDIKGTKGGFVGATPLQMGMEPERVEKIVSDVKDRYLPFE